MLGVSCQESVVFTEGFTVQWGETWALATICPWSEAPIKVPSTSMVIPKEWKHKCALRMGILLICLTEGKCYQIISSYRNEQCQEQKNWKVSNRTVSRAESFVIYFLIISLFLISFFSFEKKHPWKSLFYKSCMRNVNAEISSHKGIMWRSFILRTRVELLFKCHFFQSRTWSHDIRLFISNLAATCETLI